MGTFLRKDVKEKQFEFFEKRVFTRQNGWLDNVCSEFSLILLELLSNNSGLAVGSHIFIDWSKELVAMS